MVLWDIWPSIVFSERLVHSLDSPFTTCVWTITAGICVASKCEFLEGREGPLCFTISAVPPYCLQSLLADENTGLVETDSANSTGMRAGCPASHGST